jgi:hypothetical protein
MTLDKTSSRFLGELTFKAAETLAGDALAVDPDGKLRKWRQARFSDLLLIDQPADETGPRCINVYVIEEAQDIDPASWLAENGKRFKFGPDRLLFALRWLHKGEPPDLDLTLAPSFKRAPEIWFPYAAGVLLDALQEADPGLRERIATVAASP